MLSAVYLDTPIPKCRPPSISRLRGGQRQTVPCQQTIFLTLLLMILVTPGETKYNCISPYLDT